MSCDAHSAVWYSSACAPICFYIDANNVLRRYAGADTKLGQYLKNNEESLLQVGSDGINAFHTKLPPLTRLQLHATILALVPFVLRLGLF